MSIANKLSSLFKKKKKRKAIAHASHSRMDDIGQRRVVRWSGVAFTLGLIGLGLLVYFLYGLPDLTKLDALKKAPSITIKASNGQIIGSFGDVYGEYIPFDAIPKPVVNAVLATEDRNFFHHFGIDPFGLIRATLANIRAGKIVQGGSTITQQVAKNIFLSPDRTFKRKIQEVILALYLEAKYTKKEILAIYMNRLYLGAGNYGIDAASRRYFGKSAKQIGLPEAAILAGLLKAPSRYSPSANPELAAKRARQVLLNMVDAEMLTQKEMDKANTQFASIFKYSARGGEGAMYFADWVVEHVPEFIDNATHDLVVSTTLDVKAQKNAEDALRTIMDERADALNASQAALVSMTPSGAVRALIGGRDYGESQYNRATQAERQPGSCFKLFVYLAGLEHGLNPDSEVDDHPITVGRWTPKNYTGQYKGIMSLKDAVAQSINTVAVQVGQEAGFNNVVHIAQRLGITSELHPDPSIVLGTNEVNLMELTGAYAHLAAGGITVHPYAIEEVRTSKGKVLYKREQPSRPRVLSEDIVGMMNTLLVGVTTRGTGTGAAIGRPIAGKTGTNADYKDAWFVGYTPDLVTGVWVGNDEPKPMKKVTGGALPASIWRAYMSQVLAGTPVHGIPTGYSVGLGSILPWLGEHNPDSEQRDEPGFWDVISGGSVEHDYPSPRN